jgi:hypothetical protein
VSIVTLEGDDCASPIEAVDEFRRASGLTPLGKKQIRVVKPSQSDIIPNRCDTALKRVNDLHAEVGRMVKLIDELRADLLHLTIK